MKAARRILYFLALLVCLFGCANMSKELANDPIPRITPEELRARFIDPSYTVIDVRTEYDWQTSDKKILGAIREDPSKVAEWAAKYPKEQLLVLYCA